MKIHVVKIHVYSNSRPREQLNCGQALLMLSMNSTECTSARHRGTVIVSPWNKVRCERLNRSNEGTGAMRHVASFTFHSAWALWKATLGTVKDAVIHSNLVTSSWHLNCCVGAVCMGRTWMDSDLDSSYVYSTQYCRADAILATGGLSPEFHLDSNPSG